MRIRFSIIVLLMIIPFAVFSQDPGKDSVATMPDELAMDTTIDYDDFFDEFEHFLDSLRAPRSYFLLNAGLSQGYFNFSRKNSTQLDIKRKTTLNPSLGYYDKSGWGFTAAGKMLMPGGEDGLYQVSLSPSFDYLQQPEMALGLSYIRYITKDSVSFYVSPLQNEINVYFLWRKSWLQPGIAANYGWGSRTDYEKRLRFLQRLRRRTLIVTTTEESIADFSLTASVKHDFYWLRVLSPKDHFRFSPQLAFTSGTQQFGFNQTTGTYGLTRLNLLYSSGGVNLDDKMRFQPLSVTFYARAEYTFGKFFLQPQVLFDYYFPADSKNFTTLFSINAGVAL